jgi:Arylsulfotransferase (ASST)
MEPPVRNPDIDGREPRSLDRRPAPYTFDDPARDRRDFLRLATGVAGAGVAAALTGCSASASRAASVKHFRARRGGTLKGSTQEFRSRADLRPPEIRIDVPARGVAPGVVLTDAHKGIGQQGGMILDRSGRMLWWFPVSNSANGRRVFNLRVQSYRGAPVITWFVGVVVSAHGQGYYEIYDQGYNQVATVHAGNGYIGDLHEFVLTDQGTALFTCYGKAVGELPAPGGARRGSYFYGVVQEVDVATGKVLFQWRSDHHVPLSASFESVPAKPENTWDYFHVNSIAIDPADGNLVISSRNTWAIYKVHRRTGKVLWKLGGKDGDFRMGRGTDFAFQHDVNLYPGGMLTMFDNEGGPPKEASQSRGLVLKIDERRRRASLQRQFHHRPRVLSEALGSLEPLAGGHWFMGWGASSYFTEYDRHGRVLFDGRLGPGTNSYRAFKQAWTGTPSAPPDLAVSSSGKTAILYASWNGATELGGWSVLGGSQQGQLSAIGVADALGFETEIHVPHAPPYLAVQALDASDKILATSAPVPF